MSDQAVLGKIIQALAEYLKRDAASIKAAHQLREDLGLDSMAVIELLYKIEETFNLQIPDQDLVGLTTVGAVAEYVQNRLAPAATTAPATSKKPGPKAKKKTTRANKK